MCIGGVTNINSILDSTANDGFIHYISSSGSTSFTLIPTSGTTGMYARSVDAVAFNSGGSMIAAVVGSDYYTCLIIDISTIATPILAASL
jgi:hypothetical protein